MNQRYRIVELLVVVGLLFIPLIAHGAMQTGRARNQFSQKVTELMIMAQKARDAGDMANAELFWMHARELRPSLPRPAWLDRKPVFNPDPPPVPEEEMLEKIKALPYEQAKILLEEMLKKNPSNADARALYLEMAQNNADHVQVKRHASILEPSPERAWYYYVLAIIMVLLLLWQLFRLYHDLKSY